MSKFNKPWLAISLLYGLTATFFYLINWNFQILKQEDATLILALITVPISIISLLPDSMKKNKFKGKVYCWHVPSKEKIMKDNIEEFKSITFEINNFKKVSIQGLHIKIKFPEKLLYKKSKIKEEFDINHTKDTITLTTSKMKFLGNSSGDCRFIIELYLKDIELNKGKIFFSVSGDNIKTTAFEIDKELFEVIKSAYSTKKFSLPLN